MTRARILIVEDEMIVARDIEARLRGLGYEVVGLTGSGAEAVSLAERWRPDLVLMDISLEGEMDGVVVAREVRRRFQIPTVYLTAHTDEATLQRAKITEPFGYILKPFEERELRTVLEVALYKHQAERALHSSERRYATTLASLCEGVIATDAQGRVTYMNPVAEQLTSWTTTEAVGLDLSTVCRIIDAETRAPVADLLDRVLREGKVLCTTPHHLLLSRDGREIAIDYCEAPILDGDDCAGVVVILRDVTEYRRMEDHLRQAQKMDAIGRLAGGVAHDFNNLLTVINGYSDLILQSIDASSPWYNGLTEVRRAGRSAAELTSQLLAFSRTQVVQPKVLDLNRRLLDLEKMLQRILGEDIEVRTVLEGGLPPIKMDPGQLEQIVINLAVNARDAMPEGGSLLLETSTLSIGEEKNTAEGPSPGTYCRLRVSDSGCGIAKAALPHIFDPFFTTKPTGRGTGLGLAMVYGIVKQGEGHIEVRSEVGKGTTFTILLPVMRGNVEPSASPRSTADAPRGVETILVVEDDEKVRAFIHRVLQLSGYTVLQAGDGVAAMEICNRQSTSIHLLITDMVMPRMGGRNLLQTLQQACPQVKVLCMTGYVDNALLPPSILEGDVALLRKPFTPDALRKTVREVLDHA